MHATIVLIRHAKPNMHLQTDDFSRPLSDEGRFIQACMNRKLYQIGLRPSQILHSPFLRTTQTAQLMQECFQVEPKVEPYLGLDFNPETLLSKIPHNRRSCIFFIGHGPTLMEFAERLTGHAILNGEIEKSGTLVLELKKTIAFGKAKFIKYYSPLNTISSSQQVNSTICHKGEPFHFHIVIPSYNNMAWCKQNLSSIADQKYTNWSATLINDCSTDQTLAIARSFIKERHLENRIRIANNPERKLALANLYSAIRRADPSWIIVSLDGDDWLAHPNVLEKLAHTYADPKVWMTYGSFEIWPEDTTKKTSPLPDWVLETNSFRSFPWFTSHLKTFYAGLFQRIKRKDLMIAGKFYPMAADLATMFPLLEMASRSHIRYIPDILYTYNIANPLNDEKVSSELQNTLNRIIRTHPPYLPLKRTPHFVIKAHTSRKDNQLKRMKRLFPKTENG